MLGTRMHQAHELLQAKASLALDVIRAGPEHALNALDFTATTRIDQPVVLWLCICALVMVAVVAVFWKRGPAVYVPIIIYISALSTMTISLRNAFANHHFNYPRTTTTMHFAATAVFSFCALQVRKKAFGISWQGTVPIKSFTNGIFPSGLAFAASLAFSNLGIAETNAHFYEMVETCTPLLTCALAFFLGKPVPLILLAPLFLCMVGMSFCWSGEANFSTLGFIFLLAGAVGRAFKGVLNQILLQGGSGMMQFQPLELCLFMSLTCCCLMIPWAFAQEIRHHDIVGQLADTGTRNAVLLTVVNAIIINVAGTYVIKELGAVGAQLVGSLKGMLSVLGSWAIIGEVITRSQIVGYALMVTGVFAYNKMNRDINDAAAATEDKKQDDKDIEREAALNIIIRNKDGVSC